MRKFISYLMFAVAAAFFTGCIDVNVTPIEPQGPTTVNLQLRNADLVATRAYTDDNQYNEDLIKSVQCFFTVTGTDAVVYATDLVTVNAQQTKTLALEIPAEYLSTLFANTTKCDVYVVANYGSKITETTVTAVEAKGITLSDAATQASFVMYGDAEVTLNGTALYATVDLYRAAAKIIVKANIKTPIVEGATSWIPQIGGIKMTYNGSVNGSKISAAAADAVTTTAVTYTQTTGVFTQDETNSSTNKYVGYQTVPFYSFPVAASANKGEIDMIIPWKMGNTDNVVEYKYQIPVDIALERNHVYLLEVNVEVLGLVDGAELTPSYVIVDWTENAITAGLSRPKYFVVDENNVVLNNVNTYSIGYASSEENVTAVITSITKPDYSKEEIGITSIYSGTGTTTVTPTKGNTERFTITVNKDKNNKGKIVLSHVLNNTNTSTGYDYVPYTIQVKVTSGSFPPEYITYIQYPAMYIEAEKNPGGNKITNNGYDKGHVFVYGNQSENVSDWYVVRSCEQGGNNNPNMYIITTTSLDAASSFILSDPRADDYVSGRSLGLTNQYNSKSLTYYYASKTTNDNLVAPKFRIASSYGKCNGAIDHDDAVKRCAAYQEYGYPAGRWRVPTTAEMKYIATISNKGWIPHLFSNNGNYWTASERVTYNTNGNITENNNTSGSAFVRCVYDEWYWENDKCDLKTFTWGDQQR